MTRGKQKKRPKGKVQMETGSPMQSTSQIIKSVKIMLMKLLLPMATTITCKTP